MAVSLPREMLKKLEATREVEHQSRSALVREALRLLERADQQEAERLKGLQRAWREGLDSGDIGELDFAELRRAAKREQAARKAKA
jgi:antitoxin ParD1/3/4